jgi:multidrug resistance efflux pump
MRDRVDRARADLIGVSARRPLLLEQQRERRMALAAQVDASKATLRDRLTQFRIYAPVDSLLSAYVPGNHVGLDGAVSELRRAVAALRESEIALALTENDQFALARDSLGLRGLEEDLAILDARIARCEVSAPREGTFVSAALDDRATAAVIAGEALGEIMGDAAWDIVLRVSERDVLRIPIGALVTVVLDAAGRDAARWQGIVSEINFDQRGSPGRIGLGADGLPPTQSPLYRIRIRLTAAPSREGSIGVPRAGFAVSVRIHTGRQSLIGVISSRILGTDTP